MEFASYGQVLTPSAKKKNLHRDVFPRRGRFIKIARRAPLPFTIYNL
jgi:hypothetical protein